MAVDSPVFKVTSTGITAPAFDEVLEYFKEKARGIFGDDVNLDDDTQDGQLLSIFAAAINDINAQAVEVFSAYNPQSAYGVALDSAIKTNGITRRVATKSTVDLKLIGQVGTEIYDGVAKDAFDNEWNLPQYVVIPSAGEITVTATASKAGSIAAVANSITTIATPTRGWQSVSNPSAASVGTSPESDAELRQKQADSTMQPSRSLWEGILSTVAALPGVGRVSGFDNNTGATVDGVPAHSLAVIAFGGDAQKIAKTIFLTKGSGVGTYGTTTETVIDSYGRANQVSFSRPVNVTIKVVINIYKNPSYVASSQTDIKNRIIDYINNIAIGDEVNFSRVITAAVKSDIGIDARFDIQSATINKVGGSPAITVPLLWYEQAICEASDITINVLEEP